MTRIVALVREPLALDELVKVGLVPEVLGPPRLAGVSSMV